MMIARTIDKFRPGDDDWRTLAGKGEGDLLGRCLTTLVGIAGGQGLAFISRWTIDGAQDLVDGDHGYDDHGHAEAADDLKKIDAEGSIDEVYQRLLDAIG